MNADKPAAVNVSARRKLPTSFAAGLLGLFFFRCRRKPKSHERWRIAAGFGGFGLACSHGDANN